MEIDKNKEAFTYLALGISVMVVALVFLTVFALSGGIYAMTGSFVVLVIGLLLYEKGVKGRAVVRTLEAQLASVSSSAPANAQPQPTKFCKHCGKSIAADSSYCEFCGKSL